MMKVLINMIARLFALIALAIFPLGVFAMPSIGEAAQNILVPTEILTKLLLLTCYILGAIFIFMSFAQYRVHRQSPKLVPLTTPILLFVLGSICALIPFSSKIFGETFSAVERSDVPKTGDGESLLPLPEVVPRGSLLPIQRQSENLDQDQNRDQSETVAPSPPPSAPHWTSDPRYNR
jgi:hypothetical protein